MKKYFILLTTTLILSSCNFETPTQFTDKAYNETLIALNGEKSSFKEVINQYKGKKVLIDVWASWCADCIRGIPSVKNLQKNYPDVVFLFISVDKNQSAWKNGINRFKIKGEHYNLPNGMKKGDFVDFINLSWIPRYMVIDENGAISLFKATNSADKDILNALNKLI